MEMIIMYNINFKPFEFTIFGMSSILEIDMKGTHESGINSVRVLKRKAENIYLPFATISQDMPHIKLEDGEFVVNNWDVYSEILNFLLDDLKYFNDTEKIVESKYGESPIWKINDKHII
jgi:hypothetical protein